MNFEEEMIQEKSLPVAQEREISLGTSTILGIFLALALICAAFFGFGYSMGRRASLVASGVVPTAANAKVPAKQDSPFTGFKTAMPASGSTAAATAAEDKDKAPPLETASETASGTAASADPNATTAPAIAADGIWNVQVSTSSVKPDAEKLTGILVRQGYAATMHSDKDGRFHIKVGPFAGKKDADTTRKMLVASGYKDPFISNH